jgi:hypothetical protein
VSLLLDLQVCQCVAAHPFPPAAVGIAGKTATKQLTVASGVAALTTVPDGPFITGSKNPLTITATVVEGVSNPGKVTFTSTSKYVTFSDAKNCEPVKPPGTGVSAIRCNGTSYPMTITIGRDQKPGDLPVLATDAGGRRLALLDADKVRLRVVAPGRLQLTKFIETRPVSAGGYGLLTLTVSNPNPEPSERMPIAITLTGGLRLTYVNGLGHGFISGLCGPLWDTTCQLQSVGKDPLTLNFTVAAPPTARSGTLTVTVDHTTRSATIAVRPAPQTASAGLTLGLDLLQEPEPPSTEPDKGADATPASAADPAPPTAEPSQTADGPDPPSSAPGDTDAPETTGPAEPAPPTETTAESPANTSPDSTPPGSADPAPSSTPESNTPDGTTTPVSPPPSSAVPATEQSATSPPATTDPAAPVAAEVLLSAPLGGAAVAPGGSSALSFTASNPGGERSAALPLHFELPDGFDVRSVTVDGSVICAAGDACALPALNPGADVQVIVEVRADPGASGGAVLITVDGSGVGWRLAVLTPDATATAVDSAPTDVTARTDGGR